VAQWVAVAQDRYEWHNGLLWLRIGTSGTIGCCGSGYVRVAQWVAFALDRYEWHNGLLWLRIGTSGTNFGFLIKAIICFY
jgi:hypothetical protein